MRVLVVYATSYGATKGIAERIVETIRSEGVDADIHAADDPLTLVKNNFYNGFVIGSAIHAGHWLKSAMEFVRRHEAVLHDAPVWLFSSGPIGDKAVDSPQPDPKSIDDLRQLIDFRNHVVFGGAFDPETADLERVSWLERQISSHFLPVGDWRNWADIEAWAKDIAVAVKAEKVPVLAS
jgi:menaquinone-dependent protoporphyrinogen oxidase